MKKSNAGIIAILANFGTPEMRKALDLKITSGYPTITVPSNFKVRIPQQNLEVDGYQHITIPPDLKLHLTGSGKPKIWSNKFENLLTEDSKLTTEYQKILTVVYPPIGDFPVFTDRSYDSAEIIGFSQMLHWNQYTSFVLELFVQKDKTTIMPNNLHYPGEQGVYMPWRYSDAGQTFDEPYRKGNFFIRQFVITNHDLKPHKTMTVYFGDFNIGAAVR